MTRKARFIGSHIYFVREGTAFTLPSSGTASSTSKPGATDTSWGKLAVVKTIEIDPGNQTPYELTEPAPGLLQRSDVIMPGSLPVWSVTLKELDHTAIELIFNTLALTSGSTQFNPGERNATVKGWFKLQTYDQGNASVITVDTYGALSLKSGVTLDPTQVTEVQVEIRPLFSTLNTGSL